ncbi:hypothetical protein DWB61_00685 [Ancylomarina euxinus]|uniref:Uncharacterized protein n=1 Tax=Ancylomarina euxinus TaxID=2283627 RepID=A0A425Y839_9BACT|nr:hypothetical protein [Ancylomarina euxinus]MCZ4693571.1 hypothetical protein [Ancylomarina euxinus]MUP13799.1 hypothetical protein [Ancylomarina euxinus]RRG24567.1 hypothetical protein DWB61_00685 [Ancylomarina euxinus]
MTDKTKADKSLCYLDGRKDLWNKMFSVYPAEASKKLKNDELEMKAFIFWAMHAMDFCFSPDSEDGFDDIDIYKLSLEDLESFYEDLIEAFLIMFFIDYGYHPRLANTFYRIKSDKVGESFKDLSLYENYVNKAKTHFIARDLCIVFSFILDRGITFDELINLLAILEICYKQLLTLLKDDKAMRKIDFESLQLGFKLDSKITS